MPQEQGEFTMTSAEAVRCIERLVASLDTAVNGKWVGGERVPACTWARGTDLVEAENALKDGRRALLQLHVMVGYASSMDRCGPQDPPFKRSESKEQH